ncbi:hypothetical protein RNJ44_03711 [Nakaseomyces bracarensis]|uniref:C2H2-type domain-containing protein n=1 Tax=Nakaseomyces bracarensis TaxID=273131 RepID=A0ABR4NXT1_9SACH
MSVRRTTNGTEDNEFYQKAVEAIKIANSPALLDNTADPSALIVKELTKRLFEPNTNNIRQPAVKPTPATNTDKPTDLPFKYLLNLLTAAAPGLVQRENSSHPDTTPKSHYTYHNTSKNDFVCNQCGDKFRTVTMLKRHEKHHQPKQPNICSQCGKGFARKDALKRHYNTMICQRNRAKFLSLSENLRDGLKNQRFK